MCHAHWSELFRIDILNLYDKVIAFKFILMGLSYLHHYELEWLSNLPSLSYWSCAHGGYRFRASLPLSLLLMRPPWECTWIGCGSRSRTRRWQGSVARGPRGRAWGWSGSTHIRESLSRTRHSHPPLQDGIGWDGMKHHPYRLIHAPFNFQRSWCSAAWRTPSSAPLSHSGISWSAGTSSGRHGWSTCEWAPRHWATDLSYRMIGFLNLGMNYLWC